MSKAAVSLFVFGVYLCIIGAWLAILPNSLLSIFQVPETGEVWIRIVGMLLLVLATYDLLAAKSELREFLLWSVYVRASVILFLAVFVWAELVSPIILLLGGVDLLAAA